MNQVQLAYMTLRGVLLSAKTAINDARFGNGEFYAESAAITQICDNLFDLRPICDLLGDAAEECLKLAKEEEEEEEDNTTKDK